MPEYRRRFRPGGAYFFTVVTAQRRPVLADRDAVQALRESVAVEQRRRPFRVIAAVVLPDHLHMVWRLPAGDVDYPTRWAAIKARFTRWHLASGREEAAVTENQGLAGRRGVWQPRFLEHTIRDEEDMARHVDYVHRNPVKHGYVERMSDWPYSSIHRRLRREMAAVGRTG